ncbi:MAG: alpha/beta hydrolase [Acidimicrobiales bacterium]|nr:alpha/beta hydrolase [Acidimicrobiales bacterium]
MPPLTTATAADLFRRPPDRHLDVGAGEVAHRCVGSGPDVLFVHGWPASGATFRKLLPHLVDHVTCHVIDLPGAGSSRFDANTPLTVDQHIASVRRILDLLETDDVAVVGHDSGGLIARHAVAGDPRLRAMGLVNTEQPHGLSWRFRSFLAVRRVPGVGGGLGWVVGRRRLRRHRFVLGDAFADASLLDGEFDEFFLQPLHDDPARRRAAVALLRSFDVRLVGELAGVHRRLEVPVQLVWGDRDPFFPLAWAEEMVAAFPDTHLRVIEGAGLFAHEERPAEVAEALLPVLTAPG